MATIKFTKKIIKKMLDEETHSIMEQSLMMHIMKLYDVIGRNKAHENEIFQKAKSAFETLQKIFTPTPQDVCQDEIIDGVNWKEAAIRYKQETIRWKEENHQNLIDVNRLLIEKDHHMNEIKRLGAELYKANLNEMHKRANTNDEPSGL